MDWQAHGATHIGRVRTQNEDALLVDDAIGLAVVADGMGGHACGEVASDLTVHVFRETLAESRDVLASYAAGGTDTDAKTVRELLRHAMGRASAAVHGEARRDPSKRGMGTTCSALLLVGETAFIAHVGDSRIYLTRNGRVIQLTRDHTLMNQLVDEGRLTLADAAGDQFAAYRNALSRAVGVHADVTTDTAALEALPGDTFVVASDGLTRYVKGEELRALLAEPTEDTARHLVELANDRGGVDNITAVVAHVPAAVADAERRSDEFGAKLAAFRRVPLFRDLSYAQILHILSVARTRTLPGGAVICHEDQADDALFAILSGGVRLERNGSTTFVLGPGETFGELSLVGRTPGGLRAVATAATRILRLARADLEEILGKSPEMGMRLLLALGDDAADALGVAVDSSVAG